MKNFFQVLLALFLTLVVVYEVSLILDEVKEKRPMQQLIEVRFVGSNSEWFFTYAGPDDLFGSADDKVLGAGQDLFFPINSEVRWRSRSEDLVYCFDVRDLKLAQLVIPGQTDSARSELQRMVDYDLVPCQFCGIPNHEFDRKVRVVSGDEFELWLKD